MIAYYTTLIQGVRLHLYRVEEGKVCLCLDFWLFLSLIDHDSDVLAFRWNHAGPIRCFYMFIASTFCITGLRVSNYSMLEQRMNLNALDRIQCKLLNWFQVRIRFLFIHERTERIYKSIESFRTACIATEQWPHKTYCSIEMSWE